MNGTQDIARQVREGNEKAFEEIFKKHYAGMCGYAEKYLDDLSQAEEVVQEVFLNYWEKKATLNVTGSLEAYLYRAVRNTCLNLLKAWKVRSRYVQDQQVALKQNVHRVEDKVIALELQQKIDGTIEAMPPERKRIFKMNREEGLKYKEIAEKLGLSLKTVEAQMGKALKFMREHLVEYLQVVLLLLLV